MLWDAWNQCNLFEATGMILIFVSCIWFISQYLQREGYENQLQTPF